MGPSLSRTYPFMAISGIQRPEISTTKKHDPLPFAYLKVLMSSTRKRKSLGSSEEKGRGNIGKKILKDQKTDIDGASPCCISHRFHPAEIPRVRSALLKWYDANKRELPWRTIAQTETRPDVRGYSVWVSGLITTTFVRISFEKNHSFATR